VLSERWNARGEKPSFYVLYQGLVDTDRCIEEIIASAEHFNPGCVLTIVGHGFGKWASPVDAIPASAHIEVIPHIPYHELVTLTASASIGLLFYRNTCRNNYYCAPNKLYEYMMMGLPIITCDYPGLKAIVEKEGIGICVNPEDPQAIAEAVNSLASDAARYRAMKENCLRLAKERYNWEKEFELLRPRYRTLLRQTS
jgi:glycosyltransferase involved in cell wall biosynthesis